MAITTIQGVGGAYSPVTGFNIRASAWSGDINISTVEDTAFADNGWESHKPVKIGFSGAASGTGQYDGASAAPAPSALLASTAGLASSAGALTLTAFTGCTLAFTAQMEKVSFNRPCDGKLDLSHSFKSVGAITQTWDES